VTLDYYLWSDKSGLSTGSARFQLAGIVPMNGAGGDRTLVPEYPGITDAGDVTAWDPPFPVDLTRVRPKDEQYWDDWRTAPKAFIPLARGQALWPSPFGAISSLRIAMPPDVTASAFTTRVTEALRSSLDPFASGFAIRNARAEALASATGTTDFGEYFVYFSFFLLVAGLLLAGMFFAMGVEQRTREIGLLGALGFAPRAVRGLLMREAMILTAIGSVLGALAAVAYAALIMYGLRTWWVGAVGTTALQLHVSPIVLVAGTVGAFVAAIVALRLAVRRLLRRSARDLLTGDAASPIGQPSSSRAMVRAWIAGALATLATGLAVASASGLIGQVAGFFACGGLLLVAGLMAYSAWLWKTGGALAPPADEAANARPRSGSVARLGMQYSRWRPGRSVLSAALIAFACFVLVAVGAFRRDQAGTSLARDSGTGGYALMAESVAPLMYDPDTPAGRTDLGLAPDAPVFANTHVSRFRLRPGDEVSCLTLYRPTSPRIIAPEPRFLDEQRFQFAASLASTPEERANPWLLLNRRFDDGAVAAVVDQTSLMYVFHLGLGDDFTFAPDGQSPVTLRIVGALADSLLQSEMIIGEDAFVRLFPRHEGYRLWLVETPPNNIQPLATELERQLSDYGVDTIDTRARLAAYHQVENTYLSTFQTLGGLGLLVGTLGLGAVLARNVLERRRELGLLGAVGFEPRHLRTLVLAEIATLVVGGLLLGTVAALVAVSPALAERSQALPYVSLGGMLLAVALTGFAAATVAVRIATSTSITAAVKSE
jgi:ABC-type antimicrobial peptide transport system permease subunit